MRPKGKLFALLAIFAAIGLVTATGAFTSVQATRTAEVTVAGDAAALLQLQPHSGDNGVGPGGSITDSNGYAQITGDTLEINLNTFREDFSGTGVNHNATTDIQGVFNITNQGTQEVSVNISDDGQNDGLVTFYNASGTHGDLKDSGGLETGSQTDETGSAATLSSGETVVVSIWIDTTGQNLDPTEELIANITVTAETTG